MTRSIRTKPIFAQLGQGVWYGKKEVVYTAAASLMRGSATAPALLFAVLSVISLFPTWHAEGWPANHEVSAFAQRTWIYARHFTWFDVLPIWTSIDAWGYGSPMPIVYHKLFYMIAAPLALATGSLKAAIVVSLALLLTLGALGVYATLRAMGASRLASIVGGCCLITANYTVMNWYVRGAMAELASSMAVPWVLCYFVKSLSSGRLQVGIGVALGLVWLGHSVLAFFTALTLGTTYLILAAARAAPRSLLNPRTAWPSVAALACLVLPFLALMAIFAPAYDFSRIVRPPFRPAHQFRPALAYVWDTDWTPLGRKSVGLTVQLDHPMLALLAIGLAGLAVARLGREGTSRAASLKAAAPFLLALAICLFLQLPMSSAVYEAIPGAVFIQFPWRLLAIVTPALVIAAVYLADALRGDARAFVLGGGAVWMLVSCIAFAPMNVKRISIEPPPLTRVDFSWAREYQPIQAQSLRSLSITVPRWWSAAGCSYRQESAADEVHEVRLAVECVRAAMLPLPLYSSPLHTVEVSSYGRTQRCLTLPDFAGICSTIVPAGGSTVVVKLPSVASVPRFAWEQLAGSW